MLLRQTDQDKAEDNLQWTRPTGLSHLKRIKIGLNRTQTQLIIIEFIMLSKQAWSSWTKLLLGFFKILQSVYSNTLFNYWLCLYLGFQVASRHCKFNKFFCQILSFLVNDCFRNLLQPSGVMLRPAVFSLKVYRAEDIPQSEYYIIKGLVSSWLQLWICRQMYVWTELAYCCIQVVQGFQRLLNSSSWLRKLFHCDWLLPGQFIYLFDLRCNAN